MGFDLIPIYKLESLKRLSGDLLATLYDIKKSETQNIFDIPGNLTWRYTREEKYGFIKGCTITCT